jgi:multiple sugar transport system permease protein
MVTAELEESAARGWRRSRRRHTRPVSDGRTAFWLLLPTAAVLALVIGYPIVLAIKLSLFSDSITGNSRYIGLRNYTRALWGTDADEFWSAVATTAVFTVIVVTIEVILGMAMALFMHQLKRGRALARICVLIPWAVPTAVATVLWQWMFQTHGIINAITGKTILWTGAETPSRAAIIIIDVWKTAPFVALLLLAGLQVISAEVYESAKVDGAGTWRRFTTITLPLLRPALLVAVLFRILDALRMYDVPAILTNGANNTTTLSLLTEQLAIGQTKLGYGSALSTLTFLFIFIVAFTFIKVTGTKAVQTQTGGTKK